MDHRNDPVTIYCLSLIAEEAGEVAQVSGQALRFGLETPIEPQSVLMAQDRLEKELGDMLAAIRFAAAHELLDMDAIEQQASLKLTKLRNGNDNLGRPLAPQPTTWP